MSAVTPFKKALITGISGQDGAYLAQLLLDKGYQVFGTSRNAGANRFANLVHLGIKERVALKTLDVQDFQAVKHHLASGAYDEIYHLASESSVGQSFSHPREVILGTQSATVNILESARELGLNARFFFAGSSECFGNTGTEMADENTPFHPRSPYAVAKAAAYWEVANYRETYGIYACTGILFNHESPLRPERFVTKKIVAAACRIAGGSNEKLHLGNIGVIRDWGWAPEYVEAMWRMLQQQAAEDFVIATGESHSLKEYLSLVFESLGLDWHEHVITDATIMRQSELLEGHSNPSRANKTLGWRASKRLDEIVKILVNNQKVHIEL